MGYRSETPPRPRVQRLFSCTPGFTVGLCDDRDVAASCRRPEKRRVSSGRILRGLGLVAMPAAVIRAGLLEIAGLPAALRNNLGQRKHNAARGGGIEPDFDVHRGARAKALSSVCGGRGEARAVLVR